MKVLLVTGQLAKEIVEKYARESIVETYVVPLRKPVAALLAPSSIAQEIEKKDLRDFDLILVPGQIVGDISVIEKKAQIPTYRGPRYASDIPFVLNSLPHVKLSKTIPACELLRDELRRKALEELNAVNERIDLLLRKPGNLLIGGLPVGKGFPMRIMAEIIDAPILSKNDVQKRAKYYVKCGADIIDVGMIAGRSRPLDAGRAVKSVKDVVDVPVSIDTVDPDEAEAAVSAGADMILSVDAGNVEKVAEFANQVAVVVIPANLEENYLPKGVAERVDVLEKNIRIARQLGIRNVVGDLILDPVNTPGIMESLVAYHRFKEKNPGIPLLLGVGNITELMDADSVGINALLAGIASELGASILLTTEHSDKARGSVKELELASKMMFLAKKRGSAPKNLGIELLTLKDKHSPEEPYDRNIELETKIERGENAKMVQFDPRGCFKIMLDRDDESLVALHFSSTKENKPDLIIKGKNVEETCAKIIAKGLVTKLDHAAYLGLELQKAEIALRIGKGYVQDKNLF